MHSIFKRMFLAFFLLPTAMPVFAQSSDLNTLMRSHDKIYVVLAVCLIILITFFVYLIRIDLKISRKEKNK